MRGKGGGKGNGFWNMLTGVRAGGREKECVCRGGKEGTGAVREDRKGVGLR